VRIVAASNRDLEEEITRGTFREDLYYRLNVILVNLPPLRRRLDDVPLLLEHFVTLYASRNKKEVDGISDEAMDLLSSYYWPGNVRELENVVERGVVLTRGPMITPKDLPTHISQGQRFQGQVTFSIGTPISEVEFRMIKETLRYTKGDKKLAAQLLGIAPRTIYRKLEAMDNI
jgi:two-component system response regulator HydG